MRSAFSKDLLRSISHSLGRFLAIAGIVALGAGFYSGLRMTAPDMKISADEYFDGTQLMDLRVLSTYGLTDDDIQSIAEVDGVEGVMPAYETDAIGTLKDVQFVLRIHSLPLHAEDSLAGDGRTVELPQSVEDSLSPTDAYLNRLVLIDGRWPTSPNECVVSADSITSIPFEVGDTLSLDEGVRELDDVLNARNLAIVGTVRSSYYATTASLGSTQLGGGKIQQIVYVPASTFSSDEPYTEAFVSVEGARDLAAASTRYDDAVESVLDRIKAIAPQREAARGDEVRAEAQDELDEKTAEFEQKRADAYAELDDAKATLDESARQLDEAQSQIDDAEAQLSDGRAQLSQKRSETYAELDSRQAQLDDAKASLDAAALQVQEGEETLRASWDAAGTTYEQALALEQDASADAETLEQLQAALEQDPTNAELAAQVAALQGKLAFERAALEQLAPLVDAQREFDAQKATYEAGVASYEQGKSALEQGRLQAKAALSQAQAQLDESARKIEAAKSELADGRARYAEGVAEYENALAEAEESFSDAQQEIDDAQKEIDDVEDPSWYVMDRSKNIGVQSYLADADRVDGIAKVFPFMFFLVAALVALTSMTRMVEDDRVLIGTYKALGYSRARISSKYLAYAALASGLGCVAGILTLSFLLPFIIEIAYAIIYDVPAGPYPLDIGIALLSVLFGMGVTLVATWASSFAALREQPASLMRPRAPKAGKRILLERIPFIWKRLSFSWKVTFRNLFLYKKRLIMTVIGIAGCTALLLTGLGLHDAISDIIVKQFGDITRYNTVIVTDSSDDLDEIDAFLSSDEAIFGHTWVYEEGMRGESSADTELFVACVVPRDAASFGNFIALHERVGRVGLELGDDGVIVTEKLADQMGLEVGDTFELSAQDDIGNATGEMSSFVVSGIAENYIGNYVFASPKVFFEDRSENPEYNKVLAQAVEAHDEREAFTKRAHEVEGIKVASFNDETIDTYETMLGSVNMIVVVLVVAAAGLAFIVLYNLTNINIAERQREIATLKVLGFLPREVGSYVFREIIILALIGCAFGLVLGVGMESFVVVSAEVDQSMFGRDIHVLSFVWATLLTMAFSLIVMFAMRKKLARIDMVENLKSNE